MRHHRRHGFSLVELVVVIIILAVISAIAIPRIGRGAKGADESALGQNLAILRSAIEMYSAEHGGKYPGGTADGKGNAAGSALAFENQLLKYSDKSGTVGDSKDAATGKIYGPYLHKIPVLTVGANNGQNDVTVVTGVTAPTVGGATGWVYNSDTGKLIANCGDTGENSLTYDAW
jgi:prepilin-type N-terminal cleavage/methylation domain-containing protein